MLAKTKTTTKKEETKKPAKASIKEQAAKLKKEISNMIHKPEPDWAAIAAKRVDLSALWDEHGKDGKLPG